MICIDCGNNKERNELVWIGNPWGKEQYRCIPCEEIHHEQGLEKLVW
tara:strand:- start:1574 stop:1714 length:141 start_codon:yes stop_codon:yes gene_type:complete